MIYRIFAVLENLVYRFIAKLRGHTFVRELCREEMEDLCDAIRISEGFPELWIFSKGQRELRHRDA